MNWYQGLKGKEGTGRIGLGLGWKSRVEERVCRGVSSIKGLWKKTWKTTTSELNIFYLHVIYIIYIKK